MPNPDRPAGDVDDRPSPSSPTVRRAILATAFLFGVNGAIFGAIIPRLPEFKDALGLSEAHFGLAMASFPAGALLAAAVTPLLLRARSDGVVASWTMVLASLVTVFLPLSGEAWLFALCLLLFGATDAVTDIAMNAHGIRVQAVRGRSIINRFHAVWSAGAVGGAVVSSVFVGLGVGMLAQFVAVAAVCAALSVAAFALRLPPGMPDDPGADTGAVGERPRVRLSAIPFGAWVRTVAIGVFAFGGVLVEDFAQNWAALYLIDVAESPVALAGAGFIAVQLAQFVGRLTGDVLVDTFGARRTAAAGGWCVLLGIGAVLGSSFALTGGPLIAVVLGGLALAGWGVATVIPGAMLASDHVPGLPTGVGLMILNWMLRIGSMVAPPLVGLLAENAGLRWGVLPMLLGGVIIVGLARLLTPRRD